MSSCSTCVVLPAAGIGERMNLTTSKQFCQILGRPLISYTISSFERISWISKILVVVSKDQVENMKDIIDKYNHQRITVVEGSSTRHRSIYNGILAIDKECPSVEVVVLHDAVRPFVDENTVASVVNAAKQFGAAGMVRPLVSTVVATDMEGFLDHSLDRLKYRASEMPQAFTYNVIKSAYEKSTDYDLDYGTECLHLAQCYANVKVRLIDGPDSLWKVTHQRDLFAAESIISRENTRDTFIVCETQQEIPIAEKLRGYFLTEHNRDVPVFSSNDYTRDETFVQWKQNAIYICSSSQHISDNMMRFVNLTFSRLSRELSQNERIISCIVVGWEESNIIELMSTVRQCSTQYRSRNVLMNAIVLKESNLSDAYSIINDLVIKRNATYEGQTFIV